MNAKQFTLTLLFALVALVAASWGRFLEWWVDLSPEWKTGVFVFVWCMLILIGYRQGQVWMFAGIIVGPVGIVLLTWFYADKILDEWDK